MYVNIPGDDCEKRVWSIWRLLCERKSGGEIEVRKKKRKSMKKKVEKTRLGRDGCLFVVVD